jgi:hypothetical protein
LRCRCLHKSYYYTLEEFAKLAWLSHNRMSVDWCPFGSRLLGPIMRSDSPSMKSRKCLQPESIVGIRKRRKAGRRRVGRGEFRTPPLGIVFHQWSHVPEIRFSFWFSSSREHANIITRQRVLRETLSLVIAGYCPFFPGKLGSPLVSRITGSAFVDFGGEVRMISDLSSSSVWRTIVLTTKTKQS